MSRRIQENIVVVLVILLFIGVILEASTYGPRARMVPIPIALLGILFMGIQLVLQNMRKTQDLHIDLMELISRRSTGDEEGLPENMKGGFEEALGKKKAQQAAPEGARPTFLREIGALSLVVLLIGMFFTIGPIPTMFVFTCGYFIVSGHFDMLRAVAYSLLFTLSVYALFYLWLRIDMRQGYFDINFGLW